MFPSSVRESLPTYEYLCKKCGQTVEAYQKFTDAPLKKHQGCSGELRKVFHARGVVFKGSGFYATDSRKGAPATSAADNGSSNGDAKKETSSQGDSKEKVSASKSSDSKSSDTKSSDTKD